MTAPQLVVGREKMQLENSNKNISCRLCFSIIDYKNSKVIEEVAKEVLVVVLPNLNLGERHNRMCKTCYSKLFAAFNFKATCMGTEDIIAPHINASNAAIIELKELYLKLNGNIGLTDMQENQKICRLCLQLVTYGFVSLNEVGSDIMDTYIPKVNINATKNPVICKLCFNSLNIHGGFIKSCLKAQEKYKGVDKQSYVNSEETEIKLEDGHDMQEKYNSIDMQFHIKSEEIEIKMEEGDQDNGRISHNLDEGTIDNKKKHSSEDMGATKDKYILERETNVEINQCETLLSASSHENRYIRTFDGELKYNIEMYKCDRCTYETSYKRYLKSHQLKHKDPSEIHMYKCDTCTYGTKYKKHLKTHQLIHKDPSEIEMYKCDTCTYETKYKTCLKGHQLLHKDPSEIHMYKCDTCNYETKHKSYLRKHQLTHKDPSEIKMYKCETCNFVTHRKCNLKVHQLTHQDPSEIQMYRCDICTYESKYRSHLNHHQLTHKDPSEIQMYDCNDCNFKCKRKSDLKRHQLTHQHSLKILMYKCHMCSYETKHKGRLSNHQLTHRDPSEIQMYRCDVCSYETKREGVLKCHQLTHKNPYEIQMYRCDVSL